MNRLTPKTWDGHNLNDSTYASWLQQGTAKGQATTEPVFGDRTHFGPLFTHKVRSARTFTLEIEVLDGDMASHIDELKQWFSTYDETLRKLVVTDENDKDWYVMATCCSQPDVQGTVAIFVLTVPDPVWQSDDLNSDTWAITASGQTHNITPGGNQDAYPIFEITPTGAKGGGWVYKRFIAIYGRTPGINISNYPFDITGGGWNTTTLIPTKMKADGSDLVVMCNGMFKDRWIQDLNTDHTKIWVNLNFGDSLDVLLKTQIAATGAITTIEVMGTTDAQNYLLRCLKPGLVLIGTEVFSYTGAQYSSLSSLRLTGVKRAINGSSMALHAVGASIHFILNDLWIYYGNADYTWANADDNAQPMFDHGNGSSSTNTSWVYSNFSTSVGRRGGEWKPAYLSGHLTPSNFYSSTQGGEAALANPSTCMGMFAHARPSGATWLYGAAYMEWRLFHPVGMTTVVCNGWKRRQLATSSGMPALISLQYSPNGSTFYNAPNWPEAASGSANAWTPWPVVGSRASALGGTYRVIRFTMQGVVGAYSHNESDFEVTAVTVTIDSTKTPVVAFFGEIGGYELNCVLMNVTTNQSLAIHKVMEVNAKLIIDTDAKLVTYDPDDSNWIGALTPDQPRFDWLKLLPGVANQLLFADPNTGNVTLVTKWRDRSN